MFGFTTCLKSGPMSLSILPIRLIGARASVVGESTFVMRSTVIHV
ncbi:MAG: hypothetical protein ACYTKD_00480 [Planctomycetota bacterium]